MQTDQEAFDSAWAELDPVVGHIHQIINPDDEALAEAIWRAHCRAVENEDLYCETLRAGLTAVAQLWDLRVPQAR